MKNVDKMSDRELRSELRATRGLLAAAACPNTDCVRGAILQHNPQDEIYPPVERCQWCAERSELLADGY